jgi:nitrite reductase/ring-hydroxylating ferredoxin subunit
MLKKIFFIACLLLALAACSDEFVSSIPDYQVYLRRDLNFLGDFNLSMPNGCKTFTKKENALDELGFGGILVCRSTDGASLYAFDMACTNEFSRTVRVYPDGMGNAVCEKCGAKFIIGYGTGNCIEGEAKEPLKPYRVHVSGTEIIVTLP